MASEKWREIGSRIGTMSLRERLFVFAAAVVVALALVQTLLIDAGQRRMRNADDRLQGARSALVQIEQQQKLLASQTGRSPDRTAQEALAAQETRLAGLNAELETRERSLIPPERMAQVLKDVVRGQSGVRIVAFKTLEPASRIAAGCARGESAGVLSARFRDHGERVLCRTGRLSRAPGGLALASQLGRGDARYGRPPRFEADPDRPHPEPGGNMAARMMLCAAIALLTIPCARADLPDPTALPAAPAAEGSASPGISLTAIKRRGKQRLAVIGGQELAVGETLPGRPRGAHHRKRSRAAPGRGGHGAQTLSARRKTTARPIINGRYCG